MRLTLRPENKTIDIAAGETLLAAARRAGVEVPRGCRGGSCGVCAARLLFGEVRYPRGRPAGLAVAEGAADIVLLCQALPGSDVTVELHAVPATAGRPVKRLPCRVERIERRTPHVMVVHLRLPAVERLDFLAGQYLDVLLPDGARRSYSIASSPHDRGPLELHVREVPGGRFTAQAFGSLSPGTLMEIEGPFGGFHYRSAQHSGPVLLVAGGTGFAPLKAILRDALESGGTRDFHLYFGARDAEDLYDDVWLRAQVARYPRLRYVPVLSAPQADERDRFRCGWVHEAVMADFGSLAGMEVYAAGPPPMIEALSAAFPSRGLPPDHMHLDAFFYAAPQPD